jgi:hypothetical protein
LDRSVVLPSTSIPSDETVILLLNTGVKGVWVVNRETSQDRVQIIPSKRYEVLIFASKSNRKKKTQRANANAGRTRSRIRLSELKKRKMLNQEF